MIDVCYSTWIQLHWRGVVKNAPYNGICDWMSVVGTINTVLLRWYSEAIVRWSDSNRKLASCVETAIAWSYSPYLDVTSHWNMSSISSGTHAHRFLCMVYTPARTIRCLNKQKRKPSYRWQTRATRKPAKNCSNSTCLQRCRWQYWHIFIRLAVTASEICEIARNSLKIQTYGVQGHPRSSILVSIDSTCTTSY